MDKVVGKRSDTVLLVKVSDTHARVLNLDTGIYYKPLLLQSILARGYWKPYSTSEEALLAMIDQVVDATKTKPMRVS